ncbi:hypothetical protein PR202_gb06596 [Eleusine coracana subsp. coracana]|uniref:Uncharacterized protein n=1 Tax=Eleusine coracana subsp. coracana TaxID=191504 RepID=A0AAV5E886_ELECO|nr:hypothetical protein PR202_gb06596 [Eleusine coracana subsp. coracana]
MGPRSRRFPHRRRWVEGGLVRRRGRGRRRAGGTEAGTAAAEEAAEVGDRTGRDAVGEAGRRGSGARSSRGRGRRRRGSATDNPCGDEAGQGSAPRSRILGGKEGKRRMDGASRRFEKLSGPKGQSGAPLQEVEDGKSRLVIDRHAGFGCFASQPLEERKASQKRTRAE